MTEKENFLRIVQGKEPAWIPYYRDAVEWVFPDFVVAHMARTDKTDLFGVRWIVSPDGRMADSSFHALEDIAKWRDLIRLPDLDQMDWEVIARNSLKNHDPDKVMNVIITAARSGTFFIPLVNMMGFEEALVALLEEPEEVKAFVDYLADYDVQIAKKVIQFFKPDMIQVGDDIASALNLFMSKSVFDTLFRDGYRKIIETGKNAGLPVEWHCCGKCESVVDDFVNMGVDIWQPAQALNDLPALMAKYKDRLVFEGCWQGCAAERPGASEEEVRQSARDAIEQYASAARYVFWDGDPVGPTEDARRKVEWLASEVRSYGRIFCRDIANNYI